ncbi:MAG TPA: hypothetical protein ENI82_00370 [Bacteroidetes bacterium]|nr:hypothetical protein [Bacteroidota bacterium]
MKFFRSIIFGINLIVVVFTILSYIAPYVNPAKLWFFSFFGLAFPVLLIANIFFIIYFLIYDVKKSLLSLLVIIGGYQFINEFVAFNRPEKTSIPGTFSVMSYNVNQGFYLYKNKIKKKILTGFLNEQNPDILLLQEKNSIRIDQELRGLKGYAHYHIIGNKGAAIFSKFPIIHKGEVNFNTNTNSCLWADIIVNEDTVRVYSIHFESNQISQPTEDLMEDIEKDRTIQSKNIRTILSKYKTFVQLRAKQVTNVRKHLMGSPYKVIVGGDFNDPPMSYTYDQFANTLKDAFKEKGFGLGISYAGTIPLLRIDYLFVSRDIAVTEFETLRSKYSDHYPIKIKVSF